MRKKGTVIRWDSARAFGFIRSPDTVADIFFHIRDYGENRHPIEGTEVTFDEIHVGGKGPRALKVEPARNTVQEPRSLPEDPNAVILPRSPTAARSTPPQTTKRENQLLWATMGLMAFWLLLWLAGIALDRFSTIPVFSSLIILNLVTFYIYLYDKNAAEEGNWRISENQLHSLALLGGWPGAWFAQRAFHHKISKTSFQITYWATVALHLLGLLAWLIWPAFQTPVG
ncbi:hypothetical protein LPB72_10980 [Hydrogenophaga crassostreae]|uniref:CSD domain-containing protein n=1 Tax=Hydrogenophaga crassostreae TaxID=1763535 RepID=A0A162SZ07_9BURK|nr:cold shock and DUF1294 domain-containing protein [Hydrogenophaga crassostreae]AOW13530.1 hypothetical protein LPB072_12360 [Hydrogenophaga crassostreae]OAD41821.1 hypothetical protein LPB72_10980 [Hydrogenophaga crassostreae]